MFNVILKMLSPKMYLFAKKFSNRKEVKRYKKEIEKNEKYKNLHKGERCFIIASGPSTKKLDFSLFKNEVTFTVNQMARNPKFKDLNANYHLWSDRIFFEIDEKNPEDMEMLEVIEKVNKIAPKAEVFYEITAKKMIDKFGLEKRTNVSYFQALCMDTKKIERGFIDFSNPVPNYPTVVHYAIILAVYMGFSEIYLLGCDCTGIVNIAQNKLKNAQESLYAFEVTSDAAKRMERYACQRNIVDELKSQAAMFEEYDALNHYCKKNGVKLYNATNGGLLECLPRIELENVIDINVKNK